METEWPQLGGRIADLLDWYRSQLGVHETLGQPNRGPTVDEYMRDFHMLGRAWCGGFLGYGARHVAGIAVPDGVVYTPNIIRYAKAGTGGFEGWYPWSERQPGDWILYKWPGVSREPCDHVGALDEDCRHTIEGNTRPDDRGSQHDGGSVNRRDRGGRFVVGCARLRF